PYWSVLWRSGVALARELEGVALRGLRVVELGCGLAVPSIAAAQAGAAVLATDVCAESLTLVERNAQSNDVRIETATVDWAEPDVAEPAVLADRRHPEPADRALPADLVAVEQVDAERPPLGARGGDPAKDVIVRLAQGALPHTHVARGYVDVADLAAEVLRGRMVDVGRHQVGPGVPALEHGDT